MHFLKTESYEEWLKKEDHEIDKIMHDLDSLPNLEGLRNQLSEFKNALRLLKKTRNKKLAENMHMRGKHIYEIFADLKSKFSDIEDESEKVEKMEDYFHKNYVLVSILDDRNRPKFDMHFDIKHPFYLGRENIPHMPSHVSRHHVKVTSAGGGADVEIVGRFPSRILIDRLRNENLTHKAVALKMEPIWIWVESGKGLQPAFGFMWCYARDRR